MFSVLLLQRGGLKAQRDLILQFVRWIAAAPDKEDESDSSVSQGARELGLDRVPLKDLQAMSRAALPKKEDLELKVELPRKKRLTWGDIPGALEMLGAFEPRSPPREPVYDSHEWINSHYPRYGYAARSPLYSWRDWAAAALPRHDLEAYLATEQLMADDERRGGLVKQAQWELARLWDWQKRRAKLGLPPDLPPDSTSAPSSSSGFDSSSSHSSTPSDSSSSSGVGGTASGRGTASGLKADAVSPGQQDHLPVEAAAGPDEAKTTEEGGGTDVLGVWERPGWHHDGTDRPGSHNSSSGDGRDRRRSSLGRSKTLPPGDGMGNMSFEEWAQLTLAGKTMRERNAFLNSVHQKMEAGRSTASSGMKRSVYVDIKREHQPQRDGEDLFMPAQPYDQEAGSVPRLPPLDPALVAGEAAEQKEQEAEGDLPQAGRWRRRARPGSSAGSGPLGSLSRWSDMPLLDRRALEDKLVRELAAQAAPKFLGHVGAHWSPPDDGWAFDLAVRPPTPALDLLTDYLEVKYRDILLKRDSVSTLQRRMYAQRLAASGGEGAELPPSALVAPLTLSPAEREQIVSQLDSALVAGDVEGYRCMAEALYRDGLISATDLLSCLAAASAAVEEAAADRLAADAVAADSPGSREALYQVLCGAQPVGRDASLAEAWADVAARAASASSSSDALGIDDAKRAWQAVLSRAGLLHTGPQFEELLAARSNGSSGAVADSQLRSKLLQLQSKLRQRLGPGQGQHLEAGQEPEAVLQGEDASSSSSEGGKRSGHAPEGGWQLYLWQRTASAAVEAEAARNDGSAAQLGSTSGLLDAASMHESHRLDMEAVPPVAAPYAAARRLLRWEQQIIIHAAGGTDIHPDEGKVVLRVHARELADEVGLTAAACKHMLRIAGTKAEGGRYDPATGELKLVSSRFPTREENRRWCLEVLHRLLMEANKLDPSPTFLLSAKSGRIGDGCSSPLGG